MSLLSPESLSVFISPSELVAVRWCGFLPQIAEKKRCPIVVGSGTRWEGSIQALADLLQEFPSCKRVQVILSGHFAAHQLMPWRDDVNDSEEELAVARMAFSQTYGDIAEKWQIRISDEPPGSSRIAAAVDSGLLAALNHVASTAKARITCIQPYLTAAMNHWRDRFTRNKSVWVVLHEEGRICLAFVEHGKWRWIRSLRVDADWATRLPEVLDGELLLAGIEPVSTLALIFAPTAHNLTMPANSSWSFRSLNLVPQKNFSPVSDGHFSLALLG